jgi:hypothetical protein
LPQPIYSPRRANVVIQSSGARDLQFAAEMQIPRSARDDKIWRIEN